MAATVEAPPRRAATFRSLTGVRGIAAGAVFVNHIGHWMERTPLASEWLAVTYAGICGVILFFVLSGFLLAQPGSLRGGPGGFWARRAARILPVYVLSLVVAAGFAAYYDATNPLLRPGSLLANLLLVQSWGPAGTEASLNLPAWSLSVELLFYAVLPLTLPRARAAFTRRPGAWLAALVVLTQAGAVAVHEEWVTSAFPPVYLPVFFLGVHAAVAPRRRPVPAGAAGALALVAVVVSVPFAYFGVVAAAFAVLIGALAADGERGPLASETAHRFGVWSYAFFLFHVPVGVVLFSFVDVPPESAAVGLAFAALQLALSWVVAGVVYRWFEEPARVRLLRQGASRPVSAR